MPRSEKPFDAFSAYQRERAYSRALEDALARAFALLRMECDRREGRGEDVSHIRQFLSTEPSIYEVVA